MTKEEKKMKRYVAAVKRRLNLPREMREQVVQDLTCLISAGREAGKTDEEIYAELGSPKKAAAERNVQMQAFAYRKSPWRYVFAAAAVYSGIKLLGALWVNLIYLGVQIWDHFSSQTMAVSVGIIGGADGPTAIFVTAAPWVPYLLHLVLLIVGICGFLRLSKCKKK